MTRQDIIALQPCERVALYLEMSAKMAFVGARLHQKEKWSDNDLDQWDAVCDAVSYCYYALTDEEMTIIEPFDALLSNLDKGIWPLTKEVRKETCFYCNKDK